MVHSDDKKNNQKSSGEDHSDDKLAQCEALCNEYLEGWKRSKADFANQKKLFEDERLRITSYAKGAAILDLLPVLDNLERALEEAGESKDGLRAGVENILTQFKKILSDNDVQEIDDVGEPFDPAIHQAVSEQEVDSKEKDNIIVVSLQKGYMFRETVLRPSSVTVGTFKK